MKLFSKNILEKHKIKNKGNVSLIKEINKLINDIELNDCSNQTELKKIRSDADCVHSDGFYFFNISIHRTMIMIEFEEDGRAEVVWVGNHQEYDKIFKNNKKVIAKWLNTKGFI